MDPSIMKLLEEDEDESMHSGADVEAFTAALNRDIKGDASSSEPSDSDNVSSQGINGSQMYSQWQTSNQDDNSNQQHLEDKNSLQQHPQYSSMDFNQYGSGADNVQQKTDMSQLKEHNPLPLPPTQSQVDHKHHPAEPSPPQFLQPAGLQTSEKNPTPNQEPGRMVNVQGVQNVNDQKVATSEQASNALNKSKQVPFALLLPRIVPLLDKDKAMQLQTLYSRLKKNEIPKEGFVRLMRNIVGDHMLKSVVQSLGAPGARSSQAGPNQQLQSQASAQQHNLKMPAASATQFAGSHSFAQLHQQSHKSPADPSHTASSAGQMHAGSSYPAVNNAAEQGLNKQQKQHMQFPPTTFPPYGSTGGNYLQYTSTGNTSASSVKAHSHQNFGSNQLGSSTQATNAMSVPKFDRPTLVNDSQRMHGGSFPHSINNPSLQQKSVPWQSATSKEQSTGSFSSMSNVKHEQTDQDNEQRQKSQGSLTNAAAPPEQLGSRISSATPPAVLNAKTPPKKPSIGQKKPLETLNSSPPLAAKKQKVSGAFLDQSIEQLNDVTAISGVNLREEEEQLFSGPKEDSRVSEASRRVVQEEEERLILQRAPLQKKLEHIMVKCGLKSISNDVERCLSLCLEERMRGLISNLIRLSKQRVDTEKSRHRIVITSDVRQQISLMNKAAREELEKKQAEAEKLRKLNEPESSTGTDADKEKDEGRGKAPKVNKEEDDKMRATAANVAARAAVGGDDMLSKWQLMAEQNRQKQQGGDSASSSQPSRDMNVTHKPSSASGKSSKDNQDAYKKVHSTTGAASGHVRKGGKAHVVMPQIREIRSISVKDIIAILEREPQMAKSPFIYRLYEKMRTEAATEL